ncbi:MAG TPA: hypothetical protein P5533_05600 [Candidatus Cloacimonadota bacterium]|nr:hypothetical protein [Candidatus Cloacimonadota bacterium]
MIGLRREYLGLKIFAVALAFLLWIQANLMSEHRTVLNLPVQFRNAPKDVSIKQQQEKIPYLVEGRGIEILRFLISKTRITIDASKIKPGTDILALDDYRIDLPVGIDLKLIGPATGKEIAIEADSYEQKQVPVELSFSDNYTRREYLAKRYLIQPETLDIYGAGRILRNVQSIKTEEITRDLLSRGRFSLSLISPQPEVSMSVKAIKISLLNDKNVNRVISGIAIESNMGKNFFPGEVTIKVSGPSEALAALDANTLKAELAPAPESDGSYKVSVSLPGDLSLEDITPSQVRIRP